MSSAEVRITSLRVEIDRLARVLEDPEQKPHIIAMAGRRIAEHQLELQELTGESPSITLDEVDRYEVAVAQVTECFKLGTLMSSNIMDRAVPAHL